MYQLSTRVDFPEQVMCCDTADLIIYATLSIVQTIAMIPFITSLFINTTDNS